jgi:hypothetical protein
VFKDDKTRFGSPTECFGAPTEYFGAPTECFGAPTEYFGAPTGRYIPVEGLYHPERIMLLCVFMVETNYNVLICFYNLNQFLFMFGM